MFRTEIFVTFPLIKRKFSPLIIFRGARKQCLVMQFACEVIRQPGTGIKSMRVIADQVTISLRVSKERMASIAAIPATPEPIMTYFMSVPLVNRSVCSKRKHPAWAARHAFPARQTLTVLHRFAAARHGRVHQYQLGSYRCKSHTAHNAPGPVPPVPTRERCVYPHPV